MFSPNKTTLREVGNLFVTTLSSMHTTLKKILNFFVEDLALERTKFPKGDEEKKRRLLQQNLKKYKKITT